MFWLTAYEQKDKEEKKNPIKLCLDVRVVPPDYVEKNPVGKARSEPNIEP
jgi:hypothetical protein